MQGLRGPADEGSGYSPNDQLLLKADQVAKMIEMSRTKVYEMMNAGVLPIVRIGSAVRVPRQRLLQWIEKNITGG